MKGFLLMLVTLGCIIFAVTNYLGYQKTGTLPAREWWAHAQSAVKNVNGEAAPATVKISKWTDAKGVVHYDNRPVEGAKTIEVDPNKNVLPPAPIVELPASESAKSKPKTINEEVRALQEAKDAQMEAIINR